MTSNKRTLPVLENYRSKLRKTLLENFLVDANSSDLAEYYLENDKFPEFLEVLDNIQCTYHIVVSVFSDDHDDTVYRRIIHRTPETVVCDVLVNHPTLVQKMCHYINFALPRTVLWAYLRARNFDMAMFLMTRMPKIDLANVSRDLFDQRSVLDWFVQSFPDFLNTCTEKYLFTLANPKAMKNWLRHVSVNITQGDRPLVCYYLEPQQHAILDVILAAKPNHCGSPFTEEKIYLESAKKLYEDGFSVTPHILYQLACHEKVDILSWLVREKGEYGLFSQTKIYKFSFCPVWNTMCFIADNWTNRFVRDHKKFIFSKSAQEIYSLLCQDVVNEKVSLRVQSCPPTPSSTPCENTVTDTEKTLELLKSDLTKETYEIRIADLEIDFASKVKIYRQYKNDCGSANSGKGDTWMNAILGMPFGKKASFPITIQDGSEKISSVLQEAKNQMDSAVFGHDLAKSEIVDYLARLISNPTSKGNVIGLCGEKGIGKTRLLKQGVSKTLGRPFFTINMGGMKDSSVLKGHSPTWHGSVHGLIVDILTKAKVMNPIIYLDEVDKIDSPEVSNVLMHLLDPEQNSEFKDEYFIGINIDLSGVLFVLSLNDETKMDPVLRDRVKMVYMDNLSHEDKKVILVKHIIPDLCADIGIQVTYDPKILEVLVSRYQDEAGCRQLKKCVETILQKMNTKRIMSVDMMDSIEITMEDCQIDTRAMKNDYMQMYN